MLRRHHVDIDTSQHLDKFELTEAQTKSASVLFRVSPLRAKKKVKQFAVKNCVCSWGGMGGGVWWGRFLNQCFFSSEIHLSEDSSSSFGFNLRRCAVLPPAGLGVELELKQD